LLRPAKPWDHLFQLLRSESENLSGLGDQGGPDTTGPHIKGEQQILLHSLQRSEPGEPTINIAEFNTPKPRGSELKVATTGAREQINLLLDRYAND
jgi:hypothetical protein